jgi:FtsP/CotA-like multicopper oxidase with cupredoxin domain
MGREMVQEFGAPGGSMRRFFRRKPPQPDPRRQQMRADLAQDDLPLSELLPVFVPTPEGRTRILIMIRWPILSLLAALAGPVSRVASQALPRAVANDNRQPAGQMQRDTLALRLTVTPVSWHILADTAAAFTVLAFAEEGRSPTIPGPLIRVRVGTPVRVDLRNPLADTLILYGLTDGPAARDSFLVLPDSVARIAFVPRREGTYLYWGLAASLHSPAYLSSTRLARRGFDSQLAGAIVVDPPGPIPHDRVFVITELGDREQGAGAPGARDRHGTPVRQFNAVNGKAWPYTERLRYAVGDSIRWRLVNASPETHPLHLHGSYFRVDGHGTPQAPADSIYPPGQRRIVATEPIGVRHTATIVWSPDRPGGWLFHCHLTNHVAKLPRIDRREDTEYPSVDHHDDPDRHAVTGMNGLILGVTVPGRSALPDRWRPARRLRLFVQSDSTPGGADRRFGYVLERDAEPRRDSLEYPGPVLVLTRGEPTSIEIVNRSPEPTAVHWHGIELDSYYDGVAGWSGTPNRIAPAIRPGKRFEVRLTPRRAGTFMYHTHLDDIRQQYGGLVGALVVVEPGERWDPEHDLVFLLSDGVPGRLFVNGSLAPEPKDLEVGTTYRMRIADIAVYRLSVPIRLVRDSALVSWRPIAKDGYPLPGPDATMRPSLTNVLPGETADFEFTPDRAGDLLLIVGLPNRTPEASVRFRVAAPR